jgi:lysophospholipase L1-like esterase
MAAAVILLIRKRDRNSMKRVTLYRYSLAFGSLLFALAIAELTCWMFVPPQPSLRFQQDVAELNGLKLDAAAGMIQNDTELFWRLAPNTKLPKDGWPFFGVIANAESLREDHEIPLPKPDEQTRILFLGDSCTFGYGVAHDETFAQVTETLLQDQTYGSVECINAGVPGYTLFQGYRYLVTEGLRLQPDVVVLNFGWNDNSSWDNLSDPEHYALSQAKQPPGPLKYSHLSRLIWNVTNNGTGVQPTTEKRPRLLPEEFLETLEKIYALTQERRIPLLILVWPMQDNAHPDTPAALRSPLQLEMIAFGQAHPLSASPPVSGVLDLVPLGRDLVREHGASAIYFDHGHVTELGHQAIGQAIASHLTPWTQK